MPFSSLVFPFLTWGSDASLINTCRGNEWVVDEWRGKCFLFCYRMANLKKTALRVGVYLVCHAYQQLNPHVLAGPQMEAGVLVGSAGKPSSDFLR